MPAGFYARVIGCPITTFEISDASWRRGHVAAASDIRQRYANGCLDARGAVKRSESLRAIADPFALRRETLRGWLTEAPAPTVALMPVDVVLEPGPVWTFAVVSPAWFRVEGLALDDVAALLARLG